MPGTHEELFALIHLITDPTAAIAQLKKMDDSRKAMLEAQKASEAAREEAAQNNAQAQKALATAREVEVKASNDRKVAQDRKDKAEIALSEGHAVTEKNRTRSAQLDQQQNVLTAYEKELEARTSALALREQKVDELNKELNKKMDQLKQLTA